MATKKSSKRSKKNTKKQSSKSKKSSMSSSSGGDSVYCVHERKKAIMLNGQKKIITMKNGNKRAMMEGSCKSCGKKVVKFVSM